MHRTWSIPELVSSVFIHLDTGDLARIARVCRDFWAPAIALRWRTLLNPIPLLGFFVNPEFETRYKQIVACRYTHLNLERFRLYAPFVRSLWLDTHGSQKEGPVISALVPFSTGSLFPNLQELHLRTEPTVFRLRPETLDNLLSPSLRRFTVEISYRGECGPPSYTTECFIKNMIQTIRAKLPKLDDFSLDLKQPTSPDTISTIINSLSGRPFHRLSFKNYVVYVGPLPDVAPLIRFLSQVENLKDLTFMVSNQGMMPTLPDGGGFTTLETLQLSGYTTPVLQFMSLVQSPQLKTLCMDFIHLQTYKMGDQPILKPCERFKYLTVFKMDFQLVEISMKFDDIRPLLKCSHLETVEIYLPKHFCLERGHLEAMASSWPHLAKFSHHEWDDAKTGRVKLTILDLPLLSQYCPRLEVLEITVNMDSLEAGLPDSLPPEWVMPRLTVINFQTSKVGKHRISLVRLVAHLWPNLEKLECGWWPPELNHWKRVWDEVKGVTRDDIDYSDDCSYTYSYTYSYDSD
ncbi:hypothetical protein FRB99_007178 [Tulasnella sp. 403]|nr:hypothetical protein FRB99_007178 [Tulasnella sp. 403]